MMREDGGFEKGIFFLKKSCFVEEISGIFQGLIQGTVDKGILIMAYYKPS